MSTPPASLPRLAFAAPRNLPPAESLPGRVAVLDIAFAATVGTSVSFEAITLPFLRGLGDRLAAWVDHHDHERHADYAGDARFTLASKQAHGGCPEMVTPDLVARAGAVDTLLTHLDLDGLYAAAKWLLGGVEPYPGADDDARIVDTRRGEPGPIARRIDAALRARFRDEALKRAVVRWLVAGRPPGADDDAIEAAAREFAVRAEGTRRLAAAYEVRGRVAVVRLPAGTSPSAYDKTDLLLEGQQRAPVSMVLDSGNATIAADFSSGWDFVALLALGGGMPTRVTVPAAAAERALAAINAAPEPTPSAAGAPQDP